MFKSCGPTVGLPPVSAAFVTILAPSCVLTDRWMSNSSVSKTLGLSNGHQNKLLTGPKKRIQCYDVIYAPRERTSQLSPSVGAHGKSAAFGRSPRAWKTNFKS